MPYVKKTFRLDAKIASELEKYAKNNDISQTDVVQDAIRNAILEPYACRTQNRPDSVLKTLQDQLRIKDEQIGNLNKALLNAQESVKASQVLQAANLKDDLLPESKEHKEEKNPSFWKRFFGL